MEQSAISEQVIAVATRLFAGLGYDMTSVELIADAAGVPASEIIAMAGSKRELYLEVMERVYKAMSARLQPVIDGPASGREAAHLIADVYLDFYAEQPELLALLRHRWVSDAADIPEIEDRYLRPLLRLAAHRIDDAVPPGLGAHPFMGIVVWCVNGFIGTGLFSPGGGMVHADDPEALELFRAIMHSLIDRLLASQP